MPSSSSTASKIAPSSDAERAFGESYASFLTLCISGKQDQKTFDELTKLLKARAEALETLDEDPSLRPGVPASETRSMIEAQRQHIVLQYESLATQASVLGKEMPAPDGALATVVNQSTKDTP
jgi:hypothetical protein